MIKSENEAVFILIVLPFISDVQRNKKVSRIRNKKYTVIAKALAKVFGNGYSNAVNIIC